MGWELLVGTTIILSAFFSARIVVGEKRTMTESREMLDNLETADDYRVRATAAEWGRDKDLDVLVDDPY